MSNDFSGSDRSCAKNWLTQGLPAISGTGSNTGLSTVETQPGWFMAFLGAIRDEEIRERIIRCDEVAKTRLEEIIAAGANQTLVLQFLKSIQLAISEAPPTKPGKPVKRVRKGSTFAAKILKMAAAIEAANKRGGVLSADELIYAMFEPKAQRLRDIVQREANLPKLLRSYVADLEGSKKRVANLSRSRSKRDPATRYKAQLVEHVRSATGSPHYAALADLISAAYVAAGASEETITKISEKTVELAWKRNPQLRIPKPDLKLGPLALGRPT